MTWKEKTIVRILLLVARMLAEDSELREELQNLANHISVWGKETVDARAN